MNIKKTAISGVATVAGIGIALTLGVGGANASDYHSSDKGQRASAEHSNKQGDPNSTRGHDRAAQAHAANEARHADKQRGEHGAHNWHGDKQRGDHGEHKWHAGKDGAKETPAPVVPAPVVPAPVVPAPVEPAPAPAPVEETPALAPVEETPAPVETPAPEPTDSATPEPTESATPEADADDDTASADAETTVAAGGVLA